MKDRQLAERLGGIYEHSPWVAERALPEIGDATDAGTIAGRMAAVVDSATRSEQLALIRAHPDLAVCAAEPLTEASRGEQESAGLDRLTPGQFEAFSELNERYRAKFGFPFVIAVRGRSAGQILEEFRRRVDNDPDLEFATALAEIHRIARLRLDALEKIA